MHNFPPNISPRLQTLTAIILAYAFVDDFTAQEQVAIGNWFLQIGQTMVTIAQFQKVIEDRIEGNIININSKQFKCGGSPYMKDPDIKGFYDNIYKQAKASDFEYIQQILNKLNEKIEQLKKEMENK